MGSTGNEDSGMDEEGTSSFGTSDNGEEFSSGTSSNSHSSLEPSDDLTEYSKASVTPDNQVDVENKRGLMIQMTSTKARLTYLNEDGTLTPLQNENGKYSIPFWMALIKRKFFVFGPSVEKYSVRAKSDPLFRSNCLFWDVGVLIKSHQQGGTSRKIIFNDEMIKAPTELLVGLFFNYLKTLAGENIQQVILCVPLWFGSQHRERVQNAAKIAGFEDVVVVNEISVLAHLHASSELLSGGAKTRSRSFLVVSENSDNIDLAFYQESMENLRMVMVACSGNLHTSCNQAYSKLSPVALVQHLLASLAEKLLKDAVSLSVSTAYDLVLFCEDRRWKSILEAELNRYVTVYEHLGAPPITKGEYWFPPVFRYENTNLIEDLLPFAVLRSDMIYDKYSITIMDTDMRASRNGVTMRSITSYPSTSSTVYQQSVKGEKFDVGTLEISRILCFQYAQMEISLIMSKGGIIQFDAVYACNVNGNIEKKLESPSEYRWTLTNLPTSEIENCRSGLFRMRRFGEKYQLDVVELKEELWRLCNSASEKIWMGHYRRRVNRLTKRKLTEKVDKILPILRDSYEPLMDLNLEDLQKWKLTIFRYKDMCFEYQMKF